MQAVSDGLSSSRPSGGGASGSGDGRRQYEPIVGTRDHGRDLETLVNFLREFEAPPADGGGNDDGEAVSEYKYWRMIDDVALRKERVVAIELDDCHAALDADLARAIESNSRRYLTLFEKAIDQLLPDIDPAEALASTDVDDVFRAHRLQLLRQRSQQLDAAAPGLGGNDAPPSLPALLSRRYEVRLLPRRAQAASSLRLLRSSDIGRLVVVRGIVTRVTEVKPMVVMATYVCDECREEVYQEVTGDSFMPLDKCPSRDCAGGRLTLQTRGSRLTKFQSVTFQEAPDEVPVGHVPRALRATLRGELTRSCAPGDLCTFAGIFLPTPAKRRFGGSSSGASAGLVAETYLHGQSVRQHKKSYVDYEVTPEIEARVAAFAEQSDVFGKLARSLAPEIWGNEYVKKALLLLMVGGVTRSLGDGMKIRGDINICLMGDPGVAKSQLLKHVATIVPRGVYTSGKGSSGVGLTAAVLRDPITSEMSLEGGSLVLADMGVCCIDEFDKMEDADRTAIHEVMEQQTISIAKAGITTTLNARTSILAAANPAYGRYNPSRSPSENINLPAALLSRFDLMFLLLDRPNRDQDALLAEHVTYVHRFGAHPDPANALVDGDFLRNYVALARRVEPYVPPSLTEYIVAAYVNMRNDATQSAGVVGGDVRAPPSAAAAAPAPAWALREDDVVTARSLLAVLRLSQALARLRFSTEIEQSDVDTAIDLMHASRASLDDRVQRRRVDPVSGVFDLVRSMAGANGTDEIPYDNLLQRAVHKGYTQSDVDQCLQEYSDLDVLLVSRGRGRHSIRLAT